MPHLIVILLAFISCAAADHSDTAPGAVSIANGTTFNTTWVEHRHEANEEVTHEAGASAFLVSVENAQLVFVPQANGEDYVRSCYMHPGLARLGGLVLHVVPVPARPPHASVPQQGAKPSRLSNTVLPLLWPAPSPPVLPWPPAAATFVRVDHTVTGGDELVDGRTNLQPSWDACAVDCAATPTCIGFNWCSNQKEICPLDFDNHGGAYRSCQLIHSESAEESKGVLQIGSGNPKLGDTGGCRVKAIDGATRVKISFCAGPGKAWLCQLGWLAACSGGLSSRARRRGMCGGG